MPIKVPKVVTGKWIARLIHRSKLRWNSGALAKRGTFCALGMIAKEAGFSTWTINRRGTPDIGVAGINDSCRSRKEVIEKFCNTDREFVLGPWIKSLEKLEDLEGK